MHANLVRAHTTPINPQARLYTSNSASNVAQYTSNHDARASTNSQPSRSSDSTQNTSTSTLFNPPTPAPTGSIGATDNVINRVADKDSSLFQACTTLRARLARVPGLYEQILDVEYELADEEVDPVMLLWNVFRKGYPLVTIYNALNPQEPLEIDESQVAEKKRADLAAYKFLQACITKLGFPTSECYMLNDLKSGTSRDINMSGFVKVVKQVNRVVDLLVQRGVIAASDQSGGIQKGANPGAKRTHREHIVDELVRTERSYVQHLGLLQDFSRHVRDNGVITHDAIHDIFFNLDQLLEFQTRFLLRIENVNAQTEHDQNWGKLFLSAARPTTGSDGTKDFRVYEPFIANQKRCEETTMREFEKLRQAGGSPELRQMVESPTVLTSFLLKPFQRLSKYPLLLKELRDKGRPSPLQKNDLSAAIDAVTEILHRTNDVLDKEERQQAVRDLKAQVEDWKHHRVEAFGDLLLYGNHTVLKGDPTKDNEREYRMYLFEKILLCCKEINPNKAKNKVKPQAQPDKKGRPKLQLKGRIFMQNVTDTVNASKPGNYTCTIFWRGDDVIEHFVIRFATDEIMKKWCKKIGQQRQVCQDQARSNPPNTSDTEFQYVDTQHMINPYHENDGQDDDGRDPAQQIGYAESVNFPTSRNGSNTSLRSRSTTGESGAPPAQGRALRPNAGLGNLPPLTIRSQNSAGMGVSPGERMGASYFSPGGNDSPVSSRTSTSSSLFPAQRQHSAASAMASDEHRYTAPASSRERGSLPRDAQNYYSPHDSRGPQHPYAASAAQSRYRSASNPDVQHAAGRRTVANAPPVPSVPHHLAHGSSGASRSGNNSPMSPERTRQASGQRNYFNDSSGHGYADNPGRQDPYDSYRGATNPPSIQTGHNAMVSPPLGSASTMDEGSLQPSQLKVKVRVPSEGSAMTLVVGFNITYEKLKDRIDAKLARNTNVLLSAGTVKLKYWDENEYISIQTDDDVLTAFETWKEQQQEDIVGQLGEIELFCHLT